MTYLLTVFLSKSIPIKEGTPDNMVRVLINYMRGRLLFDAQGMCASEIPFQIKKMEEEEKND